MEIDGRQFVLCPKCQTRHLPGKLGEGNYASNCLNCGFFFKFHVSSPVRSSITFTINGETQNVGDNYPAALSLNEFMRGEGISYGTKAMCREGGCGVCLVTTTLFDPVTKSMKTYTVNSCLLPLYACDGMQVTTIEGLGNPRDGLHPIQDRLAQYNGSQCGFCSPAQVMNMYGLLAKTPTPTMQQVEDNFDVSVCRCTGYRPILDAMKSFAIDAPPSLPGGTMDIEEIDKKVCKKTGQACTGRCSSSGGQLDDVPLHMVLGGAQWYKPISKQELYSLLGQHKGDNYRLVFGNSGYGVYKELGTWNYDVLFDLRGIKDFYDISVDPNKAAVLGSSVSFTGLLEVLRQYADQPNFPYFRDFSRTLTRVANIGVRNLSTWAGNLALKNAHKEFPSDIFTMFETVGATLTIGSSDGFERQYSPIDFLPLDMKDKVIVSVSLPVFATGDVFVKTFKVSKRHQNDHAYVNAGIRMQIDRSNNYMVKTQPSIVYGGISEIMVHATNTETFLVGKSLGDSSVLSGALSTLSSELKPDTVAGLSSVDYRKSLAVSLFYKFVLGMCNGKTAPSFRSGGTNLVRPLSSGTQTYGTHKDEWPLTQPITKKDATLQTCGRLQFVNDVPPRPGELYGSFVISSVGNAEIDSVDPSDALAYPGVVKYISSKNIPKGGVNNFMMFGTDEEVFCSGQVLYSGQPIGLIVAVDKLTADTGASMVKITYMNETYSIIDVHDAMNKGSIFSQTNKQLRVGKPIPAIAQSDKKISGQVRVGHQYHFHLETQVSLCYPTEDGGITIFTSTQWADLEQEAIAQFLNIPESSINLKAFRAGGAFGGKGSRSFLPACACALATQVLQKPVRLAMNFHTNMKALGGRYPNLAEYQVGFTNEGKLNGIKLTINQDAGCTPNESPIAYMTKWIDNAYFCPNWEYNAQAWKTNLPTNTPCRAPGATECIFIMDTMMEHVARTLDKDPLEIRKLNLYQNGQKTPMGTVINDSSLGDILNQLETTADIARRKQQIEAFNKNNRWKKRGISVMPLRWAQSLAHVKFNVYVNIYHGDGSVAISMGGIEVGQGLYVKMMQVVAYELGIPLDMVTVKPTTSHTNANSRNTAGSQTTGGNALGLIQCCQELKTRMNPGRTKMGNPTWKQLVEQCFNEGVDLSASVQPDPPTDSYDYNIYGATCTEVELDVLTGENQITRVDILYDCGESLNPEIDVGQAEGAFVMGLGYWLTEEMIYEAETGTNLTDGTWEYKPPLSKDIPIDFRVSFLKNRPNKNGVLGSKAVGEPPLCMAASVVFAMKHAIESARKDAARADYFQLDGPATVEAIQTACQTDISQLTFGM